MFYSPVSTNHANTCWCSKFYQSIFRDCITSSCNKIIIIIVLRLCGSDIVCSSENPLSPSLTSRPWAKPLAFAEIWLLCRIFSFCKLENNCLSDRGCRRQLAGSGIAMKWKLHDWEKIHLAIHFESAWLRENTFGETFGIRLTEEKYIWNSLDRGEIHFLWQSTKKVGCKCLSDQFF